MDKRKVREIPFLRSVFPKKDPFVFDSCLGCGATSIGLKEDGIDRVASNEIDPGLLSVARVESRKRNIGLTTTSLDWRSISTVLESRFDAVLCLGNSLTYVFDPSERDVILRNFRSLLAPGGVLVIDERNYPRILRGEFTQSGEYVYCGIDKVSCKPVYSDAGLVVMEYHHLSDGTTSHLHLYPFKQFELRDALVRAGFDVQTYGDYQSSFEEKTVEFFTHVARVK
ncbi:class I SAM-dependent methyltransferase [Candidatus Micrarchaeota archaeon]|nr:class I SAM-dependent methyltransferase [Candidatus Micrarchaeota archaeon]